MYWLHIGFFCWYFSHSDLAAFIVKDGSLGFTVYSKLFRFVTILCLFNFLKLFTVCSKQLSPNMVFPYYSKHKVNANISNLQKRERQEWGLELEFHGLCQTHKSVWKLSKVLKMSLKIKFSSSAAPSSTTTLLKIYQQFCKSVSGAEVGQTVIGSNNIKIIIKIKCCFDGPNKDSKRAIPQDER